MSRAALALLILGASAVLGVAARREIPGAVAGADPLPVPSDALAASIDQAAGLLVRIGGELSAAAKKIFSPPDSAAPYLATIREAEQKHGLPESLLARLLYQESRFRPDIIEGRTVSSAGAVGIAQIVPKWHPGIDPLDPFASIDYAAGYLRRLYDQFGEWSLALAAYNWGPGNLARQGVENAPRETRDYMTQILSDVST